MSDPLSIEARSKQFGAAGSSDIVCCDGCPRLWALLNEREEVA